MIRRVAHGIGGETAKKVSIIFTNSYNFGGRLFFDRRKKKSDFKFFRFFKKQGRRYI